MKKIITYSAAILLMLTVFLGSSCKKHNRLADCGCNSVTISTVSENIGYVYYKVATDPNDTYYNNQFWITVIPSSNSDWASNSIICNENILPEEIKNLKHTGGSLTVKFSGELKNLCTGKIDIPERTYQHITLTKIEIQ